MADPAVNAARLWLGAAVMALAACGGAPRPSGRALAPLAGVGQMSTEFRAWLDRGRTPERAVEFVIEHSKGFERVDLYDTTARTTRPGDRLLFVDHDRTAILVVVGNHPLATGGARIIGSHIDTPSPKLNTTALSKAGQSSLTTFRYGGMRGHHWPHTPLAMVGRVAKKGGATIDIELGLNDDFAFYVAASKGRTLTITTSSTPTEDGEDTTAITLVRELHKRYGLTAMDLEAAEIYLVPVHRAREVGFDRAFIAAHGQDDRVNSYAAWRAIADLNGTPTNMAITWLVDREEVGSSGATGARSRFLEMVFAYLLRAEGGAATEATMARAFDASSALSADTPAALNPNFPEVHEKKHAPVLGKGPAIFPYTGHGGKRGGSAAHPELIASLRAVLARAGVPTQMGLLGRVDEGGGGTIAKYLAHRGIDVVDIGITVISMHSPMELSAKADVWAGYRGFREWLGQ